MSSNPKVGLLLQASIEHVKSLMAYTVCQTPTNMTVSIYIDGERVMNIDLPPPKWVDSIDLKSGTMSFKCEDSENGTGE